MCHQWEPAIEVNLAYIKNAITMSIIDPDQSVCISILKYVWKREPVLINWEKM